VLQTYGQGEAVGIVAPTMHHASDLAVIVAGLMNGLLVSKMARDDQVHHLHIGKGANGINFYPANGRKAFAFRGGRSKGGYDRVEIRDRTRRGKRSPNVIATVTDPKQVPDVIRKLEKLSAS
jgi:hypothetical protein